MPCGGIWPIKPLEEAVSKDSWCYHCVEWLSKSGKTPDHEVEEWDAVLHGDCVEAFLKTDEGKLVIEHNHLIQVYDDVLQEETPYEEP